MDNSFFNELLGKISAYDLANTLIPGAFVALIVNILPLGKNLFNAGWPAWFVASYVLGLVSSRIGSLCIEPLAKRIHWIQRADYSEFANAQMRDPKVEQLLMISNMYRTMAGAGVLVAIIMFVGLLPSCWYGVEALAGLSAFIVLFVASWVKQDGYVNKRIEFNVKECDNNDHD